MANSANYCHLLYEGNAWFSKNTAIEAFQLGLWPVIFVDHETLFSVKVAGGNDLSCYIFSIMTLFSIKLFLVIQKFMQSKSELWTFCIYCQNKNYVHLLRFRSGPL